MKKFNRVYIEITNNCNLNCNFCPKTGREKKFMNINEFNHILDEIKPYTKNIFFHIMGEPLLNTNLKDFLDIAYDKGFSVTITTNGTLIKKNQDILLNAKSLKKVNISLHSFEANDKKHDFYEYINEILDYTVKAAGDTNIVTALRLWNKDTDKFKADNLLNQDILKLICDRLGYEEDIHNELKKKNSVRIKRNVYINSAEKFKWPDINSEVVSDIGFCYGLRTQFGILCDGTVVPCCLDSEGNISLGNIFEKSICDILMGERAQNIYNGFSARKRVEKLCKTCGYSERF